MAGYSHIGVATHDMDLTIEFYTSKLGFKRAADHRTIIEQGGVLRQVYIEIGKDEFLVFMEPKDVAGIPSSFPTGINEALGTPAGMYHLAFKVDTLEALSDRRDQLRKVGLDVSDCIDLGHAQSIFLADPNGLQIEFCCHTRAFTPDDLNKVDEASIAN